MGRCGPPEHTWPGPPRRTCAWGVVYAQGSWSPVHPCLYLEWTLHVQSLGVAVPIY